MGSEEEFPTPQSGSFGSSVNPDNDVSSLSVTDEDPVGGGHIANLVELELGDLFDFNVYYR